MNKLNHHDYTQAGVVALKTGTLLTIISFIAVMGTHLQVVDEATVMAPVASTAPAAARVVAPAGETPYVYFPAQYDEAHAPDATDAPTF